MIKFPDSSKLDLGCGRNKKEGYTGVDVVELEGVDIVWDLTQTPYPANDEAIDRIYTHHTLEHLTPKQLVEVMNECWRILQPHHEMEIIVPLFPSDSAIDDLDHKTYFGVETFGRFEPENQYAYEMGIKNKWRRKLNDWTPAIKVEERSDGVALLWPRMRELHVILEKLP